MEAQYKDEFISHYETKDINKIIAEKRGDVFYKYREEFENVSKNQLDNDHPMYIVLAVNSYCNLRCKMCIRSYTEHDPDRIDLPLQKIKDIVKECEDLGIPSIFLGATAESLLRKDIKDVIRTIGEGKLLDNFLITNGTRLSKEISELLIDLQYERLYVSLDAATPESYKEIRGADLNVVESNIETFLKLREEKGSKLPVIRVSFVIQDRNRDEVQKFYDKWKDKVDIIDFQNMIDYSGWDAMKPSEDLENIEFKCAAPFRMLYIDYNGDIYPCSSDYCYHMKVGNINEMTIKEAWNSKLMKDLREQMRSQELCMICKNCAHFTEGCTL